MCSENPDAAQQLTNEEDPVVEEVCLSVLSKLVSWCMTPPYPTPQESAENAKAAQHAWAVKAIEAPLDEWPNDYNIKFEFPPLDVLMDLSKLSQATGIPAKELADLGSSINLWTLGPEGVLEVMELYVRSGGFCFSVLRWRVMLEDASTACATIRDQMRQVTECLGSQQSRASSCLVVLRCSVAHRWH